MVKPKKTQKTVDTWKKKRWHKLVAPKLFNEQFLGETPAIEPNKLVGRTISLSLMNLTRDMKKQGVYITFEVNRVMGDTGFTHVKAFQLTPPSIKRQVKRRKDRVDDSFVCKTADSLPVRMKPFLITMNSASNSIGTKLRRTMREYMTQVIARLPYDVLVKDLVSKRFQVTMRRELQKVYPLKSCEIRVCKLELGGKKIGDVKTEIKMSTEAPKPAAKVAPKPVTKVEEKKPEPKAEKPKEEVKKEAKPKEEPKAEAKPKVEKPEEKK